LVTRAAGSAYFPAVIAQSAMMNAVLPQLDAERVARLE
jgi:hypothetical protein